MNDLKNLFEKHLYKTHTKVYCFVFLIWKERTATNAKVGYSDQYEKPTYRKLTVENCSSITFLEPIFSYRYIHIAMRFSQLLHETIIRGSMRRRHIEVDTVHEITNFYLFANQ